MNAHKNMYAPIHIQGLFIQIGCLVVIHRIQVACMYASVFCHINFQDYRQAIRPSIERVPVIGLG